MFEKVNPSHPDKLADRIAGAIVDIAYKRSENPRIAVEVLLGHGHCHIIAETDAPIDEAKVVGAAVRITGNRALVVDYRQYAQDKHLAENQRGEIRCGDNGIFKGVPVTPEQARLSRAAREIYSAYPSDGKYIIDGRKVVICQSLAKTASLASRYPDAIINPLGDWSGGTDTDSGATNRKLGSDMGDSVTGGGLHGKDLSKADVSVNIWCWLEAQRTGEVITASCAIGDTTVNGVPYSEIVKKAREFIIFTGGFEKFAEWGLV